ncbi:MAG: MoaD/ThiS family protein [Promethearchaeota archaeon]|nr:MAG: MoaD/ThiS family protein [Candidatus Lokiarchaeota archaeon]
MKIKMKLYASLAKYFPDKDFGEEKELSIPDNASIKDVLEKLGIPEKQAKIVLVNGIKKEIDHELTENDTLVLFPPIGGG